MHEDDDSDDYSDELIEPGQTQGEDDDEEIIIISKSQLKREAHALLVLGKELVNLPASQYAKIPMSDDLRHEIDEARRITSHIARKRQQQHIGKLLRGMDTAPLAAELEKVKGQDNESKAHFHRIERWRDRLIAEGDAALTELLNLYPQADRQHLRQLARNAHKEQLDNKPPRATRELFKYVRGLMEGE